MAGVLSAGMNCVTSVTGQKTQITFEETIEMLEPTEERAGAIVIPFDDFMDMKEDIEQACVYLRCKASVKKKLKTIIENIQGLKNAY